MSSDRYSDVLHALALHIGVDPYALEHSQEIVVDGFAVGLLNDPADPQAIKLFCTVTELPAVHTGLISRVLLKANFLDQTPSPVTLGLRSQCDEIVACSRMAIDQPPYALAKRIRHLSFVAHDWRLLVHFLADQLIGDLSPLPTAGR